MSLGESDRPGPGPGETRALLRRGRVTVVGLGGVGGHAATALAVSGVGALHVIDQGTVAQPDLNRQPLYAEADVGRAKVAAGADRLRQLNAGIEVTGKQGEISGAADLECIASECDVLLLCARTPPDIAAWANLACLQARTPWISAGYAGPGVTVGTFVPGHGGCWQCARTALASGRCRSDHGPRRRDGSVRRGDRGLSGRERGDRHADRKRAHRRRPSRRGQPAVSRRLVQPHGQAAARLPGLRPVIRRRSAASCRSSPWPRSRRARRRPRTAGMSARSPA